MLSLRHGKSTNRTFPQYNISIYKKNKISQKFLKARFSMSKINTEHIQSVGYDEKEKLYADLEDQGHPLIFREVNLKRVLL